MVPAILRVLTFHAKNALHRPMIQPLELLTRSADCEQPYSSDRAAVPMDGIVPDGWRALVLHETTAGKGRMNRIRYERCVLNALWEKLRWEESWVQGARKHRNPALDLSQDFNERREA
jgi:hypothetical protein